ncbi:MAG: PEP-CTERM sorting domain-containing protein [Chthoniobacterales bacterium]
MKSRASWNSIGSAPFALTVLTVLGLGGGFLLALLPFNSVDRSVTSPRRTFPELQPFPMQDSTSTAEPLPDSGEASKESNFGLTLAPASTHVAATVHLDSTTEAEDVIPSGSSRSSDENLLAPANATLPTFASASEHLLAHGPVAGVAEAERDSQAESNSDSQVECDSLQTAVVPEPSTWTLLVLAMVFGVIARLFRKRQHSQTNVS